MKKITINGNVDRLDLENLLRFFNNKYIREINLKKYSIQNLKIILFYISNSSIKNVDIIIWENKDTRKYILNDMKLFSKLEKEYNIKIKIKYSKEYKRENFVKEVNLKVFKLTVVTVIFISILSIFNNIHIKKNSDKIIQNNFEQINEVIEDVNYINEIDETSKDDESVLDKYYLKYSKAYDKLLNLNNDTVGWLFINDTNINYPIVQTVDNEYYLNHSYNKVRNIEGWLFVDYRNNTDILNKNTIVYGHNSMIDNGPMFSTLVNTLNSNWYNKQDNLIIDFSIKGVDYKWKIFSIYITKKTNEYLSVDFTDEEFANFITSIKSSSIKDFNVDVEKTDKILTLSTCYQNNKYRLVVHAKMI